MQAKNVLLLGGSGFVGGHVAEHLVERGISVRIPTRRREKAKHLILLPTVDVVEANIHDPAALQRLMNGVDTVINLVGTLHSSSGEPYGEDFRLVHVELPQKIVAACHAKGVTRLIHMSALAAASGAPSEYLRSKAAGEAVVLGAANELAVTTFRPSVIFGEDDRFLNMFAKLQRVMPVVFLAAPGACLQPVYVVDVARAIVEA